MSAKKKREKGPGKRSLGKRKATPSNVPDPVARSAAKAKSKAKKASGKKKTPAPDSVVRMSFPVTYYESQLLVQRAKRLNVDPDELFQQCLRAFTDRKVKGGNQGLKINITGLGRDEDGNAKRKKK